MTIIRKLSFAIPSLTLVSGLALPPSMAHAADVPLDSQAQAQRVIVAAFPGHRKPVAECARILDVQLQANRLMVAAAPLAASHRAVTAGVHRDAQESARRLLDGSREGV